MAPWHGLRRVRIDALRNPKVKLLCGEQKSLQTDRVILLPGPAEEKRVVQRMYTMFVNAGRPKREIAETLNAEEHHTDLGRPWTRATVDHALTKEKDVGNVVDNVFAKFFFKTPLEAGLMQHHGVRVPRYATTTPCPRNRQQATIGVGAHKASIAEADDQRFTPSTCSKLGSLWPTK